MTAALTTLKQHLAGLVPPPSPGSETGLTTGIESLDAALPSRGVPIGRLTELLGARGSGKTTFLRRLVRETVERKLWVAYVDASRTLAPRDWAGIGDGESAIRDLRSEASLWMIRPTSPSKGTWCADVLLRSGAFALVVLDGAPLLSRSVTIRLTRLARSAGAALVVTGEESAAAIPGALRLRIERGKEGRVRKLRTENYELRTTNCELPTTNCEPRIANQGSARDQTTQFVVRSSQLNSQFVVRSSQFNIVVEKGGIRRRVEVNYGVGVASRLCAHPEVPDRRGVGRTKQGGGCALAGGWKQEAGDRDNKLGDRNSDSAPLSSSDRRQHPRGRARRCAESDFGREERSRGRTPAHEPKSESAVRGSQSKFRSSQLAVPSITVRTPQSAIRSLTTVG